MSYHEQLRLLQEHRNISLQQDAQRKKEERHRQLEQEAELEKQRLHDELEKGIDFEITPPKTPTCGRSAIHKLIDRAFYSINKPASEIEPDDVMKVLQLDHEQKGIVQKIDKAGTIIKIEGNDIYWQSENKKTDKPFQYRSFCDYVKNLKAMLAEDLAK